LVPDYIYGLKFKFWRLLFRATARCALHSLKCKPLLLPCWRYVFQLMFNHCTFLELQLVTLVHRTRSKFLEIGGEARCLSCLANNRMSVCDTK